MRRYAVIGPSEDSVIAVDPITRRAPGARPPFVARQIILIPEISAAGTLHDVPADSRHISELARCGEQETFGDDRETIPHVRVRCHIAHSRQRADAQPTVA